PAESRAARSRRAEDLPGVQIRGNGRDPVLPGVHHQVPFVHRSGTPQTRPGADPGKGYVMSCSPFDLRDYFLQELPSAQSLQVETHVKTCDACREELHRLQATQSALFTLRDEAIPQRIGFVSDKIFEPSPAPRWLAAFWGNTARLGFACAAMLSAALIYSASLRPTAPAPQPAAVTTSSSTVTAAEIDARIHDAVVKAVA